jgi:hypothetical protein
MALTVKNIRTMLKDIPDLNILLEGSVQSGDELIALAMQLGVSEFNSLPPVTQYVEANFPSDSLLFYVTAHFLANGEAEKQLRNQVNYNAQGLNVNMDDKYEQYLRLAQHYYQLFMQRATTLKQYINIDSAWGQVSSPYGNLNEFKFRS